MVLLLHIIIKMIVCVGFLLPKITFESTKCDVMDLRQKGLADICLLSHPKLGWAEI